MELPLEPPRVLLSFKEARSNWVQKKMILPNCDNKKKLWEKRFFDLDVTLRNWAHFAQSDKLFAVQQSLRPPGRQGQGIKLVEGGGLRLKSCGGNPRRGGVRRPGEHPPPKGFGEKSTCQGKPEGHLVGHLVAVGCLAPANGEGGWTVTRAVPQEAANKRQLKVAVGG